MKKCIAGVAVLGGSLLLVVQNSEAGGLYLYEIGSPDVGYGAAGYAARADDASTVFTNPAGMTRLDRPALMVGAQPMYTDLDFSPGGDTSTLASTLPGGGTAASGDSNNWLAAGGVYYVHPVNERFRLGFALIGNFGLALDYQDDWVGRYYAQEATLQALAIQPAVSWKINDRFSVGAGVAALYGMLENKLAVNNILPSLGDGGLKLEDEAWGLQFNLGLLFEPQPGTRLGVTYLSQADLDFSANPEFSNLGPGLTTILDNRGLLEADVDLGVTVPQALMCSVYHELTDRLALLANLGWQDWSEFGKVDVSVDSDNPTSLTTELDYDDTWHVAVGAQYRLNSLWQLSGGIAYDSAMMDEDQIVPALPVGDTWRFGLGSRYQWSQDLSLGAAYALIWIGDLDMDVERGPLSGRVSGTYGDSAIHVISLNAEYRF